MHFIFQSVLEGVRSFGHDAQLGHLIGVTLRLALESTAIALLIGLPLACVLGLGRSRSSRWAMVVANAGLGLPPVTVGVYARTLLTTKGIQPPWGGSWLNSLNGMVLCQAVIALPIVTALGALAVRSLPDGLIDQARAFGASRTRLSLLALREAKLAIATAVIVALASAVGEVGAISLIIGSAGPNETLATQVVQDSYASNRAGEMEHVLVLLAIMALLGAVLIVVRRSGPYIRRRARPTHAATVGVSS